MALRPAEFDQQLRPLAGLRGPQLEGIQRLLEQPRRLVPGERGRRARACAPGVLDGLDVVVRGRGLVEVVRELGRGQARGRSGAPPPSPRPPPGAAARARGCEVAVDRLAHEPVREPQHHPAGRPVDDEAGGASGRASAAAPRDPRPRSAAARRRETAARDGRRREHLPLGLRYRPHPARDRVAHARRQRQRRGEHRLAVRLHGRLQRSRDLLREERIARRERPHGPEQFSAGSVPVLRSSIVRVRPR